MISNEQATEELRVILRTHPTLQPLRELAERLSDAERLLAEQALVDFLTSTEAYDSALRLNLHRSRQERAAKGL